ncbi:MAG: FkbM family methyltransferase [Pseudomonadota bacterium]
MTPAVIEPPFGTYALPPWAETLRRIGLGAGQSAVSRRLASVTRRLSLLGRTGPVDVEPFPGQRARLYPQDNLSEKRVFGAPQFWDAAERLALAGARAGDDFYFVDAGANVGLYTLAVRSHGPAKIIAIEPDPENLSRLRDNLEASGADEVIIAPVALSAEEGTASLAEGDGNRGETTAMAGPGDIPARPLHHIIDEAGWPRIDALKIDIEGAEEPVLAAFFKSAPPALWPRMVLIEAHRGAETRALALLRSEGYIVAQRTRLNAILHLTNAQDS